MHIHSFAKLILFSEQLSEKLFFPEKLEFDGGMSSSAFPMDDVSLMPGRPPRLKLQEWNSRQRATFPQGQSLKSDVSRGIVLHFFANHELLALEIMALALLRFPAAPLSFQRGLVSTMRDEQNHLRLYLDRMNSLGVGFGDLPVNDFFWTRMKNIGSPFDFVTQMSLTFEQANLDHALFYKNKFAQLGDSLSSDILQIVLEDELKHVSHGLGWFRQWKLKEQSDWEAYSSSLSFPLTPARAKGPHFSVDLRHQCGFDSHFIRNLLVFSHSKGRPPNLYFFTPNVESEFVTNFNSFQQKKPVATVKSDLESVMMFLCSFDDMLIVESEIDQDFLLFWAELGIKIPQIVTSSGTFQDLVSGRVVGDVMPFGWSPKIFKIIKEANFEFSSGFSQAKSYFKLFETPTDFLKFGDFYSKTEVTQVYESLLDEIFVEDCYLLKDFMTNVSTLEETLHVVTHVFNKYPEITYVVIKEPFGSSGRNRKKVARSELAEENFLGWLKNSLKKNSSLVVQPWLHKQADFSVHGYVSENGGTQVLGLTQFLTDVKGQYLGTVLVRKVDFLSNKIAKILYSDFSSGRDFFQILQLSAQCVGHYLAKNGFRGAFSFDAMLVEYGGKPIMIPLLEINPRFTMGRVALELEKKVSPSQSAIWAHFSKSMLDALDIQSFCDLKAELELALPRMTCGNFERKFLKQGAFFTNPPANAKLLCSCLLVADTAEALRDAHPMIKHFLELGGVSLFKKNELPKGSPILKENS